LRVFRFYIFCSYYVIKMHQINCLCFEHIKQPKWHQKILRFSIFFFRIFLKIMFKNKVCANLTTKTSTYRVDVSQLSLQCLFSFLLSLLSKKIDAHFVSEIFPRDLEKFIFFVRGRNLTKTLLKSFSLFRASFCKNLSKFWNLT
jgi:hypothetical protein